MKTSTLLRFTVLFGIISLLSTLSFSQYENTIGNLAGTDETTDIKPLPNGHAVALANTTSFGPQKILLLELDAAGHPVFFKTIFDPANPNVEYTGNSLELDLDAAGNPIGYFITGCQGSYPTQMILIRTNLNGIPTWARQINSVVDPASSSSECGISLERQANRDIAVVGRYEQLGDLKFSVSRFSSAGVMIWSYRYGNDHGLQFIPNESCKGYRNRDAVITVVGHIHDAGIGHTFLSCIKASDGLEFWRNQYNSHQFHDDGTDVVQQSTNNRYFVEGHAENLGSGTRLWTFLVNPVNGVLTGGATYSVLPPLQNLFGRDICLGPGGLTVTIAGFCDIENPFGASDVRTFLLNLPFLVGPLPNWSHYFTHSDPQLFLLADDAVEPIVGANPGYLLGTQAKLPGSAAFDYDVHALRVNLLGQHNLADCPIVPFNSNIELEGTSFVLETQKSSSTWSNLTLASLDQDYIEDPCGGTPPPQFNAQESNSFTYPTESLYPNPARAGDEILLRLNQEISSSVSIEILDITGQSVAQWQDTGNLIRFSLPTDLSKMMYMVKMNFSNGENRVFRLLVE